MESKKLKIIGYSKESYGKCDNCGTIIKHEFHISDGRILGCECASFIYGWNKGFSTPDSLRKEFEKRQAVENKAAREAQRKADREKRTRNSNGRNNGILRRARMFAGAVFVEN